jgi:hypothetical protein
MKFRFGVILALGIFVLVSLASCGGGGSAQGIVSITPKGDYYTIQGSNPAQKYGSPLFKELADEIKRYEDELENWEDAMDDMGLNNPNANSLRLSINSEDSKENLNFIAGPFKADDLEDYFDDEMKWEDWDEDEDKGRKYFTAEAYGTEKGLMLTNGGLLYGDLDAIEEVIDLMAEGGKKLSQDKDFMAAKELVDFNSTEFMLQWENLDPVIGTFKALVAKADDDKDIAEAIEDIKGVGISIYWTGDIKIVARFLYKKEKDSEALFEFLKDDMDKFFEDSLPDLVKQMLGNDAETKDLEDLADKAKVSKRGKVLELVINLKWE